MKISQIIDSLNAGAKVDEVAQSIGVSRKTLYTRLKKLNYVYDKSIKSYVFAGDTEEKQLIESMNYEETTAYTPSLTQKKDIPSYSEYTVSPLYNASEFTASAQEDYIESTEDTPSFPLTSEEIAQLRVLLATADTQNKDNDLDSLYAEVSQLPDRSKIKKYTVEIDERIYNDFDKLAKKLNNKRIGKATLVEIALSRLIRDFS